MYRTSRIVRYTIRRLCVCVKVLIQEEQTCTECTSFEKQDFLQFLFDAFPSGSPLVERELVTCIRVRQIDIGSCQSNSFVSSYS
jgi:hypothetical protein